MSITLYDFGQREKPNRSWSYNAWKTRLVLNYKGIPYTTAWVNSDNLGPTLKSIGVNPHQSAGGFEYTIPTIKLVDMPALMGSAVIAAELDALYPSPSLNIDTELEAEASQVINMAARALFPIYMPRLTRELVEESAVEVFTKRREKIFGVTFVEWEKTKGGELAWKAAEPGFAAMKQLLNKRKQDDGPFILGSQVSYADFCLVALFHAFKRAGDDLFDRLIGWDPCFRVLYEACEPWFENDQ
ncbi:hypothetical protein BX600DRAFT_457442 [Xylariales sp. PMI_506]|nr:hypothetical protein BX600DRAFT_457442 [Xylariales sp. PMI_506]